MGQPVTVDSDDVETLVMAACESAEKQRETHFALLKYFAELTINNVLTSLANDQRLTSLHTHLRMLYDDEPDKVHLRSS